MVREVRGWRETRLRSLVKSILYRILSITGMVFLTYAITKDTHTTISITATLQVFLIILYYLYERVWNKVDWGRKF
ncbi:MAG: hypothetical protein DRP75_03140 [Candidatus Omnitrophota bacterium]|nr:MAG: hypothetical protein DRP75_03140 [Candidatus Omnitrophota bacterium]